MKQCSECRQVYIDDSLNFCLADGSALIQPNSDREEETVVRGPSSTIQPAQVIKQGVSPVFAYLAIGLLALIAGGGLVMWLKDSEPSVSSVNNAKVVENSRPIDVQNSAVLQPSPVATAVQIDESAAKLEVSTALNDWLQTVNRKDLASRMGYYAARLDAYYTKRNVSSSVVRGENKKAFDRFSDLDMSISNVSTSIDSSTGRVTTTFDKTFSFRGANRFFEGSVRSEFRWSKIGGEWKITSERDVKVYRVNKG